jgi:hypothetical protein
LLQEQIAMYPEVPPPDNVQVSVDIPEQEEVRVVARTEERHFKDGIKYLAKFA